MTSVRWSELACVLWSSETLSLRGYFTRQSSISSRHARDLAIPESRTSEAVEIGELVYLKWEAAAILVRRVGDVALLRYQAELEMPGESGKPSCFSCWHTDSYELHNGSWQLVWSQATLIRSQGENARMLLAS